MSREGVGRRSFAAYTSQRLWLQRATKAFYFANFQQKTKTRFHEVLFLNTIQFLVPLALLQHQAGAHHFDAYSFLHQFFALHY